MKIKRIGAGQPEIPSGKVASLPLEYFGGHRLAIQPVQPFTLKLPYEITVEKGERLKICTAPAIGQANGQRSHLIILDCYLDEGEHKGIAVDVLSSRGTITTHIPPGTIVAELRDDLKAHMVVNPKKKAAPKAA